MLIALTAIINPLDHLPIFEAIFAAWFSFTLGEAEWTSR